MKVSVIIPTYNEGKVILDCLKSLSEQNYDDFEVILVDDGSKDNTRELLKGYKTDKYELIIRSTKHKGPGLARNIGAKYARGGILVFVDADMTFEYDFLAKLVEPIIKGGVKGTFSKEEYVKNWDNHWARCWNLNEGWEDGKRHSKNYPNTQKVFRAILKREFASVGGFTQGGYNDDWSLSEKLGYFAIAVKDAKYYHKNPDTLREVYEQAKWVGKREYKLGFLGYIVALLRSSFPVSVVVGGYKAVRYKFIRFFLFKIVYDFGQFLGILGFMFTKSGAK